MNQTEYYKEFTCLMKEHNGNENHPDVIALNKERAAALQVSGLNTVDASNQGQQAQSTPRTSDYSDSDYNEARWLAEKVQDLEAEGQFLARKNHFSGDE